MHILMLSDVFYPRVNGVSTSIDTFASSLLKMGHQVTLIAPSYPHEVDTGISTIRIPARQLPFDPEDRLMSLRAIKRLLPELKQQTFDVVHIQTPFVAHYAGRWLAKELQLPTVVSYHTLFEAYFEKYLPLIPHGLLRAAARWFSRGQCNEVNQVISPSLPMQEKLRDYGVTSPISIVPTGLPLAQFAAPANNDFRARHGIAEDEHLLLYVGRVAYEKNIDFLIRMFQRLRSGQENARLMIAGEGPALEKLKKRAAETGYGDDILFVGYMERATELMACYHASDVFVFASETETQGLVLLEAMACGLPVVSVASMGSKDVLKDGEGCVVSPLEENTFANHVNDLLTDPDRHQFLRDGALEYVRSWSDEAKAQSLLNVYESLLESTAAAALQNPIPARQEN